MDDDVRCKVSPAGGTLYMRNESAGCVCKLTSFLPDCAILITVSLFMLPTSGDVTCCRDRVISANTGGQRFHSQEGISAARSISRLFIKG